MPPLLARSGAEAHIYIDMHPCECGAGEFGNRVNEVTRSGGQWLSEYAGACAGCGRRRSFVFRVTEDVPLIPVTSWSDLTRPSELLDPGEWLWVADAYGTDPQPGEEPATLDELGYAASAVDEILLFLPEGTDELSPGTLRTDLGRRVYEADPGRFRRGALEVLRDTYRLRSGERRGHLQLAPVVARSMREANVYSALTFCVCGENQFEQRVADEVSRRGRTLVHFQGPCAACGRRRDFLYDVPDGLARRPAIDFRYSYPGDPPSTIVDPAQWVGVAVANAVAADEFARASAELDANGATGRKLTRGEEWEQLVEMLTSAVSAWDEVLLFIPEHAGRVPPEAFFTATGRTLYRAEPGAFARDRVLAERAAAQDRLDAFLAANPEPAD